MPKSSGPVLNVVSNNLLRLLENASTQVSGFVDEIINTPGIDGQYGGVDGRNSLFGIMNSLVVLTGSEEAAAEWLFRSRGFKAAVGNNAYLALENGDFWSLTVMQDWLHILVTYRETCPALIDAIFGPAQ